MIQTFNNYHGVDDGDKVHSSRGISFAVLIGSYLYFSLSASLSQNSVDNNIILLPCSLVIPRDQCTNRTIIAMIHCAKRLLHQ